MAQPASKVPQHDATHEVEVLRNEALRSKMLMGAGLAKHSGGAGQHDNLCSQLQALERAYDAIHH